MWFRAFKDYPIDKPLKKSQVEPSQGIVGCEMHDLNGWGESYHIPRKRKHGIIATLLISFFTWLFPSKKEER